MSDALIEVSGVSKTFRTEVKEPGFAASIRSLYRKRIREVRALDGVDMTVREGEVVGLLGANGAGKTTLLKILAGIIRPSAGNVRVLGYEPWQRDDRMRRRIALIMGQKAQLWWDLPASDCFVLLKEIYRIPDAECASALKDLSERLSVGHLLDVPIRMLSLGERMKMELIAALLHSPEVLFLDEPTIGLDVVAQHNIQIFLKRYQQVRGITILLTSHYMKDVAALCQRVVIIAGGRIVYDGSLDGIIDQFSNYKVVTLDFAEERMPGDLARLGEVMEVAPPRVKLQVDRSRIAEVLSSVLGSYAIQDVSVEDPPLEEVIASLFAASEKQEQVSEDEAARAAAVAGQGA
jgi:ABC-2 type transport system ATP-binding protein